MLLFSNYLLSIFCLTIIFIQCKYWMLWNFLGVDPTAASQSQRVGQQGSSGDYPDDGRREQYQPQWTGHHIATNHWHMHKR